MNRTVFQLGFVLLIIINAEARSQAEAIRPLFGVTAGHFLITGSFNGSDYFRTDDHIVLVPRIKPSFGMGGTIGIGSDQMAFELAYHVTRSTYTTMDEGMPGSCVTHLLRYLGFTRYFNKYSEGTFRPYMDLDLSIAWHLFDKLAYPPNELEDPIPARYGAVIFGFGAGMLIRFSDRFAFDIKVLPEYSIGSSIRVKGFKYYEIKKFGNFQMQSTFGIKYYFKPF